MANSSRRSGKINRRSEILQAAQKLMQSRGLSGVTTRQISQEVGCSEGALYVHFNGRLELLLAMLEESLPNMLEPLQALRKSVGRGSAQENLAKALDGIFKFHQWWREQLGYLLNRNFSPLIAALLTARAKGHTCR